jgi:hypothetical protein
MSGYDIVKAMTDIISPESGLPAKGFERNSWNSPETISQEIKEKKQTVDYKKLLQDKRVLFLGDNHSNSSIRLHIAQHSKELKEAGVTHYTIEAKDSGRNVFDRLNNGENVDLSTVDVGPAESAAGLSRLGSLASMAASGFSPLGGFSEEVYEGRKGDEHAIRAMAKQGIKIVPIDMDQSGSHSREEREVHLTKGITGILESDPKAKVAVIIGGDHTLKRYEPNGIASVGKRVAKAGYPTATIQFTGGKSDMPRNITDGARAAGVASQEFILDMQPYADSKTSIPYGAGETDYVIHLPQKIDPTRESMRLGMSLPRPSSYMERPIDVDTRGGKLFDDKQIDVLRKLLDDMAKRKE